MTLLQAIILGLVEGITEFLPISSTAHLIVVQKLFGFAEVNAFFTTVVQLGAIGGLMWVERFKLLQILQEVRSARGHLRETLAAKLLFATVPVLIVGFLIKDHISTLQNNTTLIASMSIAVAGVLYAAQQYAEKARDHSRAPTTYSLFLMGVFQVISLIPGTSRSGITAAGGAFQRFSLSQSLEYAFLLSIPALLAAGGYEILKLINNPIHPEIILPTFLGTAASFVCAILAVEWLRRIVREQGFLPFVIYRIIFGLAVLLFLPNA